MSLQHVANHLAQQGRGNDKMLVHMTPSEVAGLRSLAQAKGGDLTINPQTGLPEAGFLDDVIKVAAPVALGAFLGPAGVGLSSMMAGVATGGIMTLATGSLSRGLMAGLGAYGGAGLAEGLSNAGEAALSSSVDQSAAETARLANAAPEAAKELATQNAALGNAATANPAEFQAPPTAQPAPDYAQMAQNKAAQATPWEKIGSGVKTITQSPTAALDFAKNNWQSGLAAMAPLAAVQNTGGATAPPVNTGYIRQKIYDPVTHKTIDLAPVKASEWGSRNFSDIYQQPTAAATGGIVALAHGGDVARFDDGGPTYSNQQISDYVSNIQAQGGGDKEIAAAMDQFHVGTGQLANALGMNVGDVQSRYNAADTTGGYYTGTSGISNNDIRNALAGQYAGASDATLANAMQQFHIDPTQMAYATGIPLAGEGNIADRYALANDISKQGGIFGQAPVNNTLGSSYDQQWAAYMDAHKDASGKVDPIAVAEMARATGLSKNEVQTRYDAAEKALHPPPLPSIKIGTVGNATAPVPGTSNVTQTVLPTNSGTNAPAGTTNPYGNQNNPGDLTFNVDGSKTVQPNIPGRPYGGFSGMNEVVKDYTAGGGSTGYFPPAPKTVAEFNNQFNTMTGDSLAAYNYLTGKGAAPIKSTAPVISGSYAEKVLGIKPDEKVYASNVKEIFDPVTHKRIPNPNYQASAVTGTPGTTGSTVKLPNGSMATYDGASGLYYLNGKYYDASGNEKPYSAPSDNGGGGGGGEANGGLMRMAMGGMAMGGLGSLGGYSDGGRLLRGPGDGVSDSIPASIGGRQPARLADGEFVVPARIVSEIGNGSTEAGARKLYAMMDRVQNARAKTTGKKQVATNTNAAKYLPV